MQDRLRLRIAYYENAKEYLHSQILFYIRLLQIFVENTSIIASTVALSDAMKSEQALKSFMNKACVPSNLCMFFLVDYTMLSYQIDNI